MACAVLGLAAAFWVDGGEVLAEEVEALAAVGDLAREAAVDGLVGVADGEDLGACAEAFGWDGDLVVWVTPVNGSPRARSTGRNLIPFATGKPQCSNSAQRFAWGRACYGSVSKPCSRKWASKQNAVRRPQSRIVWKLTQSTKLSFRREAVRSASHAA